MSDIKKLLQEDRELIGDTEKLIPEGRSLLKKGNKNKKCIKESKITFAYG